VLTVIDEFTRRCLAITAQAFQHDAYLLFGEYCRRVALRMSRTSFSAPSGLRPVLSVIVIPPWDYDEPDTLR
jgi:hypothetical protein